MGCGKDATPGAVRALVEFAYDRLQGRRRRQILNMHELATKGITSDEEFREELLLYLQESQFSKRLAALPRDEPDEWIFILSSAREQGDIRQFQAACARQLQDSDDHPGLLFIYGVCRTVLGAEDFIALEAGLAACSRVLGPSDRSRLVGNVLDNFILPQCSPERGDEIIRAVIRADRTIEVARECYLRADRYSVGNHYALTVIAEEVAKYHA